MDSIIQTQLTQLTQRLTQLTQLTQSVGPGGTR